MGGGRGEEGGGEMIGSWMWQMCSIMSPEEGLVSGVLVPRNVSLISKKKSKPTFSNRVIQTNRNLIHSDSLELKSSLEISVWETDLLFQNFE